MPRRAMAASSWRVTSFTPPTPATPASSRLTIQTLVIDIAISINIVYGIIVYGEWQSRESHRVLTPASRRAATVSRKADETTTG